MHRTLQKKTKPNPRHTKCSPERNATIAAAPELSSSTRQHTCTRARLSVANPSARAREYGRNKWASARETRMFYVSGSPTSSHVIRARASAHADSCTALRARIYRELSGPPLTTDPRCLYADLFSRTAQQQQQKDISSRSFVCWFIFYTGDLWLKFFLGPAKDCVPADDPASDRVRALEKCTSKSIHLVCYEHACGISRKVRKSRAAHEFCKGRRRMPAIDWHCACIDFYCLRARGLFVRYLRYFSLNEGTVHM